MQLAQKIITPFPLVNAVLLGLQDGIVSSQNSFDFILHKSGFSFLDSKSNFEEEEFLNFIKTHKEIPGYFHIYNAPVKVQKAFQKKEEWFNTRIRRRVQLKFLQPGINTKLSLNEAFVVERITANNFSMLDKFKLEIDLKFWNSQEDFLTNGFGFFAMDASGEPASICYAACNAQGEAEIDVATDPAFQKRGLAKLLVTAFVDHCIKSGIRANWDCFESNEGSLRTAESLGFTKVLEYDFLSVFRK